MSSLRLYEQNIKCIMKYNSTYRKSCNIGYLLLPLMTTAKFNKGDFYSVHEFFQLVLSTSSEMEPEYFS